MQTWVDGRLLSDPDEPVVRATDHGLTVGDGVFESVKVVDGRPFALTRHLERLERSAAGIGLGGVDVAAVKEGVGAVLAAAHLPLGRLRITVTGGPAPLGSGRGDAAPTVLVSAVPMDPLPAATKVVTVPWRRNEHSAVAGLKTTSYAENVVALAHAAERGASEAVLANTAGDLCEGTGSNVFYVVDGELRTPTLASGCLAGVTRALVIEWLGAREVDEPITVAEQADEAFLVSTTRDVQAVARWGDRELPAPGPVTARAQEVWAEREAQDVDP
ncbi:aminodeoxychorismate lyase [Nocardioides sp. ChNu-153]|uniref:aminotransferase class IV n=1 Tax=unclassified Nocardioides TaxID=2615069 RepID=UPI002405DAA7|nr:MULTISPECIES: aminodeoxychorismate lyase [unclassified Nocardioides]MDF9715336.1 aminodeoxychorismate lyase [Nocardioides sp. ChNu-99]MDN7121741.1 aminodeoxychorismate lyase [Nocardioides sp. ChNu-153]